MDEIIKRSTSLRLSAVPRAWEPKSMIFSGWNFFYEAAHGVVEDFLADHCCTVQSYLLGHFFAYSVPFQKEASAPCLCGRIAQWAFFPFAG